MLKVIILNDKFGKSRLSFDANLYCLWTIDTIQLLFHYYVALLDFNKLHATETLGRKQETKSFAHYLMDQNRTRTPFHSQT